MYVAVKKMRAHGPDGQPVTYFDGDLLPHFLDFPHHVRRHLLSQHYVELRPDTVVVAQMARADDIALPIAHEVVPVAPALRSAVKEDDLKCDECDRAFKDTRGLNVHKAQAHKPAAQ